MTSLHYHSRDMISICPLILQVVPWGDIESLAMINRWLEVFILIILFVTYPHLVIYLGVYPSMNRFIVLLPLSSSNMCNFKNIYLINKIINFLKIFLFFIKKSKNNKYSIIINFFYLLYFIFISIIFILLIIEFINF